MNLGSFVSNRINFDSVKIVFLFILANFKCDFPNVCAPITLYTNFCLKSRYLDYCEGYKTVLQKLANSEGVELQIEKILDDFTSNDPVVRSLSQEIVKDPCFGRKVEFLNFLSVALR